MSQEQTRFPIQPRDRRLSAQSSRGIESRKEVLGTERAARLRQRQGLMARDLVREELKRRGGGASSAEQAEHGGDRRREDKEGGGPSGPSG